MKKLLLILLCLPMIGLGQSTLYFESQSFEKKMLDFLEIKTDLEEIEDELIAKEYKELEVA